MSSTTELRWFGELPLHWKSLKLKFLLSAVSSGTSVNSSDTPVESDQIGVLKTSAVLGGVFYPERNKAVWKSEIDRVSGAITKNCILMSRMNTPQLVGESGYVEKNYENLFLPDRLWKLEFNENIISTKYLSFVLSSTEARKQLEILATGTSPSMKNLSIEEMKSLDIPLPPFSEQLGLINFISSETSAIDSLIFEKEQMLALLEEKRTALISRAVTRGLNPNVAFKPSGLDWLGEVPEHWDVCQLKRLWASSDYGISDSIREEGTIPVLRMSCIDNGKIDVAKSGAINEVDEHLLLRRNDLLFNRTNSLDQIAKVGMIDFDVASPLTFASYLVRIRTTKQVNPEYLVYLLNSTEFLEFARKNAIPAIGQANLSPSKYGDLKVSVPNKDEQDEIARYLNSSLDKFLVISKELKDSIQLLKERRSALITAAVTGQLSMEEMQHEAKNP